MCRVIGVSGTPGVGKSFVARKLSEKLNGLYIDLSSKVIEERLYQEYDISRESYVADPDKVNSYIKKICSENMGRYIIVDSHYAEIIDPAYIHRIFVLRADPETLVKRLCSRGWSREKILENLEAELLGVCLYNALEEQDPFKICEIYEKDLDRAVEKILSILEGKEKCEIYYIDWLNILEKESPVELIERICSSQKNLS
ncbi:MAG: adenylate kinase family protein [Sulfolobales archaeon]